MSSITDQIRLRNEQLYGIIDTNDFIATFVDKIDIHDPIGTVYVEGKSSKGDDSHPFSMDYIVYHYDDVNHGIKKIVGEYSTDNSINNQDSMFFQSDLEEHLQIDKDCMISDEDKATYAHNGIDVIGFFISIESIKMFLEEQGVEL